MGAEGEEALNRALTTMLNFEADAVTAMQAYFQEPTLDNHLAAIQARTRADTAAIEYARLQASRRRV